MGFWPCNTLLLLTVESAMGSSSMRSSSSPFSFPAVFFLGFFVVLAFALGILCECLCAFYSCCPEEITLKFVYCAISYLLSCVLARLSHQIVRGRVLSNFFH